MLTKKPGPQTPPGPIVYGLMASQGVIHLTLEFSIKNRYSIVLTFLSVHPSVTPIPKAFNCRGKVAQKDIKFCTVVPSTF